MWRGTANLVLASIVLCADAISPGPETSAAGTSVHLGIVIVYDQDFHEHIIDAQRFQQNHRKGADEYLAALLRGAELRFKRIEGVSITLTLIAYHRRMDIAVNVDRYTLDGEKTMKKLHSDLQDYSGYYTEADIVVFVTGKSILRSAKNGEWAGLAERGQVCTPTKKVALVSDNGKTFDGADDVAMQIALLLNASRDGIDNQCKNSTFLLSSIYGGFKSEFSSCSQEDMMSFLKNKEGPCWKDEVKDLYHGVLPAAYHNDSGYDICSVHHRHNTNIVTCKSQFYGAPKRNVTCGVQCCDYYGLRTPFLYVQTASDGTECGKGKVCINRECVELQTSDSSI